MRIFVMGPRFMGLRPGVSFGLSELFRRSRRPAASAPSANYVYVVLGEHGAVKIGITSSPAARLAALQTGSHVRLAFAGVAMCSGDAARIEEIAHRALRRHRLSGEWFDVTPEIAMRTIVEAARRCGQTISSADRSRAQSPRPVPAPLPEQVRQRARVNMTITAFAVLAGILAAIVVGAFIYSPAHAAEALPRYDPEALCDQAARLPPPFKRATYDVCMGQQQEAYNELKAGKWARAPIAAQEACAGGFETSYQALSFCLDREADATKKPKPSFKF